MKFKKSTVFAFWSAFLLSAISVVLFVVITFFNKTVLAIKWEVLYFFSLFIIVFLLSQYRVNKFIFNRIQKVYKKLEYTKQEALVAGTDIDVLSQEIARFADTKDAEITTLKERENYRKEFIGNVSHELKTPIFTIQGYIDILLDGAVDDNLMRKKYLERAQKGVERLSFIVNDLSMISQLENDKLKLNKTTFNIIELVQTTMDSLEMKATAKSIVLGFNKQYDIPIFVFADKERIAQVLQNLINNAINYTNNDTTIVISINPHEKHQIQIAITDHGVGISKTDQVRIFERFYRVEKSRSRDQGGTGLGLSIVKHIVEAHNQTVSVSSELDNYTTFSFTLETV